MVCDRGVAFGREGIGSYHAAGGVSAVAAAQGVDAGELGVAQGLDRGGESDGEPLFRQPDSVASGGNHARYGQEGGVGDGIGELSADFAHGVWAKCRNHRHAARPQDTRALAQKLRQGIEPLDRRGGEDERERSVGHAANLGLSVTFAALEGDGGERGVQGGGNVEVPHGQRAPRGALGEKAGGDAGATPYLKYATLRNLPGNHPAEFSGYFALGHGIVVVGRLGAREFLGHESLFGEHGREYGVEVGQMGPVGLYDVESLRTPGRELVGRRDYAVVAAHHGAVPDDACGRPVTFDG